MAGPALTTLQNFRTVEKNQNYQDLADVFAVDAVYYDPIAGVQRGRDEIRSFLGRMAQVIPDSGTRFDNWHIEADTHVGWADWDLVAPGVDGVEVAVPGQSLYRLRDGEITFAADYLDTRAYRRLRGGSGRMPDHVPSIGLSASPDHPRGSAHEVISTYWSMTDAGRGAELGGLFADDAQFVNPLRGTFTGHAEIDRFMRQMAVELPEMQTWVTLADIAADATVAWSQWWFHFPAGKAPCWTLFTIRDGEITFGRDVFDLAEVKRISRAD